MKKTTQMQKILLLLIAVSTITFTGCGNKKDAKVDSRSLEQVYADEGVPVRAIDISNTELSNEMTFLATLSGIQETTIMSKIADKIVTLPVRIGQRVSAGQIVATFPTDNPQLQWEQAKSALDIATKTYNRMKNLLAAGDVSQSQYDAAETQYLVSKQNFESLKQMVYLDAPFSGTVTNIPAKVGDKVAANVPLVTIAQTGTIIAKIWVSESEVQRLKIGMPAVINIDEQQFKGKIAAVSLAMDAQRRAFQVDVHFANGNGKLKSGISTNLTFNFDESVRQTIVLPRRIVAINADETYVYIVEGDVAKKVMVKMGQQSGVNVAIDEGLKPGDKVITEGISLLADGKKIRIMQ
ncbi:MAG: efflux RND transporter periplasmic adaptor subunit [Ignavibacteria bacterium]|jgi:RND family efflux transporter MFP subunit|nr:efflux RND transporter periplasmic adaptor subunit [Ignavibacteria bacterium]